jgi:hypothetical protein
MLKADAWATLPVNMLDLEKEVERPSEDVYEPSPVWERPAGHAVQGIDAFKLLCHVNSLKEPAAIVVGDSGAAPTLISQRFLESLKASKPRPRAGRKLKLLQLTGLAGCSEYIRLNLYFRSQLGPICLKGVEAYIVKDMEANMLIGEDTQQAWQLHIIQRETNKYWKVGDSIHLIPGIPGSPPMETSAQWSPDKNEESQASLLSRKRTESSRKQWNAVAKHDLMLEPESIATVTAISRGIPCRKDMHLEAIPLKRGSDSFISAPHGIVNLSEDDSFQIKVANTTKQRVLLRAGNLLGSLTKASCALKSSHNLPKEELDKFMNQATQLAVLVPGLDSLSKTVPDRTVQEPVETVEPPDAEHLGWGPKTTDPGPDHIYLPKELIEVIDVDPALEPSQRNALYKIVEENQAAFSFDSRLGHLKSRVHIQLVPRTKPISMPPYYALPAKREIIDKQINLWLLQDVVEESKSLWGAPVIVVYHNGKPQVCIDWQRPNKATVADQHPIPKQTDILQALSGSQYLSVFNALSSFTQMEFDKEL